MSVCGCGHEGRKHLGFLPMPCTRCTCSGFSGGNGNAVASTDPGGPVISNIVVSGVSSSGATISWTTDVASTSQVDYGVLQWMDEHSALDLTLTTSHSVTLTGLTPDQRYFFRVKSRRASSQLTVSDASQFSTSGSFSPDALAGLAIWLKNDTGLFQDAARTVAAGAGDPVGSWADQSGNGRHFVQETDEFRPVVASGPVSVRTDGLGTYLAMSAATLSGPLTVALAFRLTQYDPGFTGNIVLGSAANSSDFNVSYLSGDVILVGGDVVSKTIDLDTVYTLTVVYNGASTKVYDGTTLLGTIDPGSTNWTNPAIGVQGSFMRYYGSSDIAELLVYSGALGATDLANLQNYLIGKFA